MGCEENNHSPSSGRSNSQDDDSVLLAGTPNKTVTGSTCSSAGLIENSLKVVSSSPMNVDDESSVNCRISSGTAIANSSCEDSGDSVRCPTIISNSSSLNALPCNSNNSNNNASEENSDKSSSLTRSATVSSSLAEAKKESGGKNNKMPVSWVIQPICDDDSAMQITENQKPEPQRETKKRLFQNPPVFTSKCTYSSYSSNSNNNSNGVSDAIQNAVLFSENSPPVSAEESCNLIFEDNAVRFENSPSKVTIAPITITGQTEISKLQQQQQQQQQQSNSNPGIRLNSHSTSTENQKCIKNGDSFVCSDDDINTPITNLTTTSSSSPSSFESPIKTDMTKKYKSSKAETTSGQSSAATVSPSLKVLKERKTDRAYAKVIRKSVVNGAVVMEGNNKIQSDSGKRNNGRQVRHPTSASDSALKFPPSSSSSETSKLSRKENVADLSYIDDDVDDDDDDAEILEPASNTNRHCENRRSSLPLSGPLSLESDFQDLAVLQRWTCPTCTLANDPCNVSCEACGTTRVTDDAAISSAKVRPKKKVERPRSVAVAEYWCCPLCTLQNPLYSHRCQACQWDKNKDHKVNI